MLFEYKARHDVPLKRLAEVKKRNPKFVSQREGWTRFYKWQHQFDKVLALRAKLIWGDTNG